MSYLKKKYSTDPPASRASHTGDWYIDTHGSMHSLDILMYVYHIPFCWGLILEKSTHFSFSITRIHAPEVSEKCTLSHALNPLNVKKKVVLPVVRTALDSLTFQAMLCSYIIVIFHMRTSTARTCFPGSHASTQHVSQNIAEHLWSPRWRLETWKALMPLSPKSGGYMPGNTLPRWAAAVSPYSRIHLRLKNTTKFLCDPGVKHCNDLTISSQCAY